MSWWPVVLWPTAFRLLAVSRPWWRIPNFTLSRSTSAQAVSSTGWLGPSPVAPVSYSTDRAHESQEGRPKAPAVVAFAEILEPR